MSSPVPTTKSEPWQRFTVLDVMLLQAGYALALALVLSPARRLALTTFDAGTVLVVLTTICLGGVFSGPIVLASHWLFRGRRTALSAGEWLWLSPFGILIALGLGIWALHWVAQVFPAPAEVRAVFFALLGLVMILVEIGCTLNALLVVVARSVGDLTEPPCWWTDRFGTLTCLVLGIIVLLCVLAVLS